MDIKLIENRLIKRAAKELKWDTNQVYRYFSLAVLTFNPELEKYKHTKGKSFPALIENQSSTPYILYLDTRDNKIYFICVPLRNISYQPWKDLLKDHQTMLDML